MLNLDCYSKDKRKNKLYSSFYRFNKIFIEYVLLGYMPEIGESIMIKNRLDFYSYGTYGLVGRMALIII